MDEFRREAEEVAQLITVSLFTLRCECAACGVEAGDKEGREGELTQRGGNCPIRKDSQPCACVDLSNYYYYLLEYFVPC